MEELLAVILDNAGKGRVDPVLKMLDNNQNILFAASEAGTMDGSTVLMNAIDSIPDVHPAIILVLLKIQSEHLENKSLPPFMERSLWVLDKLTGLAPKETAALSKGTLGSIAIVSRKLVDAAHHCGRAATTVLPLMRVMATLQLEPHTLTTLNAVLMEAFVSAGMHDRGYALAVSNPLFRLEPSLCASVSFDALTYCYYAGMCALAVKKYDQALSFFMDCITTPCHAGVSSVIVAALKKARVTAMLTSNPKPLEIPRYAAHGVIKMSKQESAAYDLIQKHFDADNYQDLKESLSMKNVVEELKEDGNFGLAKLTIESLLKKRMKGLVRIFSRMRLVDILRMKYSDTEWTAHDVENLLVQLIISGELSARIDAAEGVVSFESAGVLSTGESSIHQNGADKIGVLKARLDESMALTDHIRSVQSELFKSSAYLSQKMLSLKFGSGGIDDITQNPMLSDNMIDMVIDNDDTEDMM